MTNVPVSVIQVNVQRSQHAQNEFIKHFMKSNDSIALLSEPYVGRGPEVACIAGVDIFQFSNAERVKACILLKQASGQAIGLTQYSSANIAVIQLRHMNRDLILASVYVEPDTDPNATLQRVNDLCVERLGASIVIGGDFNGKHQDSNCENADARGEDIVALVASNQLSVCNEGRHPKFEVVREDQHLSSIIDITIASENITHLIENWRVDAEVNAASDHHAVLFDIGLSKFRSYKRTHASTYLFNNKTDLWRDMRGVA